MELSHAFRLDQHVRSPRVVSFTGGGGKTSAMRRLAQELAGRGVRVVSTSTTRLAAYEVETARGVVLAGGPEPPFGDVARALEQYGHCLLVTPEIVEGGVQKYPGVRSEWVDALAERAGELDLGAIIVEADGAKMLPLKAPAQHEPSLPTSTTLLCAIAGMDALGRRIVPDAVHRPERVRALLGLEAQTEERVTPQRMAQLLLDPSGGRKGLATRARFVAMLNKAESPPARAGARIAARIMAEEGAATLIASVGAFDGEAVLERWEPVAAVVLAAGKASRFGGPKQLELVNGEPMLLRAVRAALDGEANLVIVVTGAHADEVSASVEREFGSAPAVRIVHNAAWEQGQSTSIHAALRALPEAAEAALFLPVDQPFLEGTVLRRLVRRWRIGGDLVALRADGEVRGAPALFDRRYWRELFAIRGDVGGRTVLQRYAGAVAAVDVDAALLRDVDAPADLADVV